MTRSFLSIFYSITRSDIRRFSNWSVIFCDMLYNLYHFLCISFHVIQYPTSWDPKWVEKMHYLIFSLFRSWLVRKVYLLYTSYQELNFITAVPGSYKKIGGIRIFSPPIICWGLFSFKVLILNYSIISMIVSIVLVSVVNWTEGVSNPGGIGSVLEGFDSFLIVISSLSGLPVSGALSLNVISSDLVLNCRASASALSVSRGTSRKALSLLYHHPSLLLHGRFLLSSSTASSLNTSESSDSSPGHS